MQETLLTNSLKVGRLLGKGWNSNMKLLKYINEVVLSQEHILPRVITNKKDVLLAVDEYKLPAWSQRVFQLAIKAK
jgi:hypothetical protein